MRAYDFRCSPNNGHRQDTSACPFRANRTHAPQQRASLLDHLVGALLEMQRHVEAERLGGLEIDYQLELYWGLDRKLARLRAPQNLIHIRRRAPKIIGRVISVGQQAAEFSKEPVRIDGREKV